MIGVHANTSGGLAHGALSYTDGVGATAVQVFVGNPRGWKLSAGDSRQDALFVQGCAERGIPAFIHASLLVNIGSPTEATVAQSRETLVHSLMRAQSIGASAVVFHAGSSVDEAYAEKAMRQVREVLMPILDVLPDTMLLVEPSAGGGRSLAARVEDLEAYLGAVDFHPNLGVCFDTCHAWAAGHDLAKPGGMTETLDLLTRVCGPGRLKLVHANDSRDPCGSTRDRHETIGKGTIGVGGFTELVTHPSVADVPIIVETPAEHHATDISLLRDLRRLGD